MDHALTTYTLSARSTRRLAGGLLALAAAVYGCSGGGTTPPPEVGQVLLNPTTLTLTGVGSTGTVVATVLSLRGLTITNASVSWTTDNAAVATVSGTGLTARVTATGTGSTVVRATSGGVSASALVDIAAHVRSMTIAPPTLTVRAGDTAPLTAQVVADAGVSTAVTWEANPTTIATVTNTGVVQGIARGTATITARSVVEPTISATATVTVTGVISLSVSPKPVTTPRGGTQAMTATVSADVGISQAVTWRSSNTLILSVSATGIVTGVDPGTTFVVATSTFDPLKKDSAQVTVLDGCASPIAYTLGATVNGAVTIADCNGGRADFYRYVTTRVTFFQATLSPATTVLALAPVPEIFFGFSGPAGGSVTTYSIVSAGTRTMQVFNTDTTQRGNYTLTTSLSFFLSSCPSVFMTTGTTTPPLSLDATCPAYTPFGLAGAFTAETFFIGVAAGQTLRVTATSAAFPVRLELKFGNSLVTSAFAPAAGANAVLTITPPQLINYSLFVTSQTAGGAGAFTITVDP